MPGNCSRNQPTKMDRKWRGEGKGSMGGERWHSRVGIPSFAGGRGVGVEIRAEGVVATRRHSKVASVKP